MKNATQIINESISEANDSLHSYSYRIQDRVDGLNNELAHLKPEEICYFETSIKSIVGYIQADLENILATIEYIKKLNCINNQIN